MITAHVKPGVRAPRVLAVFSFRYDEHLVPGLIANITPLVDGWLAYDDRAATGLFSAEGPRRAALLAAAREKGAAWALAVDPDERFEARMDVAIRQLTASDDRVAYTFPLRELYAADRYRIDGVWGTKRLARLLSLAGGVALPVGDLHVSWHGCTPGVRLRDTDYNLYHLKMLTPERRVARAALYNRLDPTKQMQAIGYDYLADDRGAVLEEIPVGRAFYPRHHEDGGLWMPSV